MIAVVVIVLGLTVWSGGRCEKLFGRKDPNSVVIDEIASVPFALWPMTLLAFRPWSLWVVLFVVYRIFDILKPYPARSSEMFGGGVGILLDDLVSATYMGLLFWFVIRLTGF
jgi:phosphatidylglycerophosphatase A